MLRKNKNFKRFANVRIEDKPKGSTIELLKKAWNELPPDFTMGERALFMELAEQIIKVAEFEDRKVN